MTVLHRTLVLALVVILAWSTVAGAEALERDDLGHFTLTDQEGNEVLLTGLIVSVGDGFIAEDNREYRVVSVEGDNAIVQFVGMVDLGMEASLPSERPIQASEKTSWWWRFLAWEPISRFAQGNREKPRVAIYHTHNDESYVPTEGTASIDGHGGIVWVGNALEEQLQQLGIDAIHDTTSHYPHDASAYQRSRRTARDLLQKDPDLVIDVHRDTTPPAAYRREVAGRTVTQVMLVVGRQNPKRTQTDAVAKKIKAVVDRKFPGLIRGIFYARGNYNQDLSGRLMLVEVGSHRNRREHAEAGIELLGAAVPDIIAALGGPQGTANRSAGRTWIWLVLLLLAGGVGYLLISAGSWKEAVAKVKSLGGREWGDLFRLGRRDSDTGGPDD